MQQGLKFGYAKLTKSIISQQQYEYHSFLRILRTGRFIMFSMITNIYNKKTKGHTLMEFFTATGKLKKFF
jgi:hypothetical protein